MIDIHAPEHRIGGARDFFMHLLTITVGLFIALSLENGAEAWHHRQQRKEADAMIRQEIGDNLKNLREGAPGVLDEGAKMTRVLHTLEDLSESKPGTLHEEDLVFHESPIQDAAWRTASTTGVLNYMEYGEVERFADAYKEQDLLQTMEERALDDYLELMPILSHHQGVIPPELAKEAMPYVRHALAHLNGMLAVGAGTIGTYEAALKK